MGESCSLATRLLCAPLCNVTCVQRCPVYLRYQHSKQISHSPLERCFLLHLNHIFYVNLILHTEVSVQTSLLKSTGHFTRRQKLNILPASILYLSLNKQITASYSIKTFS